MDGSNRILVIGHSLVVDANRKFWSTYARETGDEVELVVPRRWHSNLAAGLAYAPNPDSDAHLTAVHAVDVRLAGRGSLFFFGPLAMARIWRAQRYDAVFVNQETWAIATLVLLVGKLLSPNRRTPLLLCVAQNLRKGRLTFLHPWERLVARGVSAFLYCSEGVADVLRWKGIRRPMYDFPLPFDEECYLPRAPRALCSPFVLGYIGRLSEDKGIDVLLRALDRLNRPGPRYRLRVAGAGPLEARLRAHPAVDFVGLIPHSRAHEFYGTLDCLILPSRTCRHWKEQFGRVIVEAFGAGVPVVGSDSGSIPEVLGRLGWRWVYSEASDEALAAMVEELTAALGTAEGRDDLERAVRANRETFSQRAVALTFRRVLSAVRSSDAQKRER
jgi:glycosyltransferase involved in cell wall biosynthesis